MSKFANPSAMLEAIGQSLGSSDWVDITQDRIQLFADATDDQQWIHVDVDRAQEGPFGGTIAHGFLTLSLAAKFLPELLAVDDCVMAINYGCNRVRFPAPVPAGSRVRGHGVMTECVAIPNGVQATITITIEIEGVEKPACVAESVSRYFGP